MKPLIVVVVVLALAGALLCGWACLNEWAYYRDHPYRTGVSGVLTIGFAGAALGCLASALLAVALGRGSHERQGG